jgi:hypothetical protein
MKPGVWRVFLSKRVGDARPLFPPQHLTAAAARDAVLHIVRRDPRQFEESRSRWSLAALQRVWTWLKGLTRPGVSQILSRVRITYQRARVGAEP